MGHILHRALQLLAATVLAATVSAQTARTWTGPEWGDFATAANWGGTAPANSLTTNYALFTGGNLNNVALSASRSIAGLEFSATATSGAISYTNTPVLTLGAYGIKNLASDSYTMQMDVGLALGANTTFTNQGDLWISGALNLGTRVLTLSGGSAWWGRLNGPISGTGSVVINHAGTGGWILNGNNTHSGGTTLTAGRLLLSSSGTGLGTGALILNGGALWAEYEGNVGNAITVAANSTLNGNNYATTHFTGAVTLTGARTLTVTGNGRVVFDGAVGQSAAGYALTKAGVGTLVLNAASTYTGTTNISGGTLALGAGGTISSANLMLNGGVLATAGTFSRTLGTGAGQLQFGSSGGGFAAYGGALTVSLTAGTDWFGLFNSQWAYFGSSVSDNVVTFTNNLALNSGDYFLDVADNTGSAADKTVFSGTLSGTGNLTKQGAGQLDLISASTRTGSTYILGGIVRATHATALGSGSVTLQSSTLQLAADTATDFGSNLVANSGTATVTGDRLTAGEGLRHQLGNLSMSGTLVVQKGVNATSGTATVAFDDVTGSGSFSVASGARVELGSFSGSSSLTFTGTGDAEILGAFTTGAGSLTKSGTGTLTLNATSSRTGVTAFSAGTLVLGADNALGTGTLTVSNVSTTLRGANGARTLANNVTFSTGSTLGGTADLTFTGTVTNANNNTLTVSNTGTTTFSGAFNLSNSVTNRTLTLNNSGALVFSGVIANGSTSTAGALAKNGLGTLTLAGTNTYAGNTTINAGTLNLTGSIASSALTNIAAGATLTGPGSLGDLMLAGTYAPGSSPALISLGDFTMGGTGLLQMEIGGLVRGTGYDALDINGVFATGGTLDVAFINGFTPAAAATFNLFDFTSLAGTFGTVNLPVLTGGYTWDTTALYSDGELKIIASAIPEPSTYAALAGLGALGLAFWRRRQARAAAQA